jgi:hypothetical protein
MHTPCIVNYGEKYTNLMPKNRRVVKQVLQKVILTEREKIV